MTELHIEIRVAGPVADSVLVELGDLRVVSERVETVLRGPVPDQAALVGMINRLQTWGVELKSLRQIVPDAFTPTIPARGSGPDPVEGLFLAPEPRHA